MADVDVLNVANHPERLGAAIIECVALGTPVVGPAANGLWDLMCHLPELLAQIPSEVPPILARLLGRPDKLAALDDRGRQVATRLHAENTLIVELSDSFF